MFVLISVKSCSVNKKHRYVLRCVLKEKKLGKKSVLRCWAGEKGRGEKNPRKGRGAVEASVCSVTGSVCWCYSRPQQSSAVRSSPHFSSAVPRDLGWLLCGVAAGSPCSFFLVTCLLPAPGSVLPLMLTSAVFLQSLISGLWCICSEGGHRDFGWQQMVNLQAATGYTGVKLGT